MHRNVCRVIDELSALFEISQILERSLDLPEIVRPVLQRIGDVLALRLAAVTIFDQENAQTTRLAELVTLRGSEEAGRFFIQICEHYVQDVGEEGKPVIVPDIARNDTLKPYALDHPPAEEQILSLIVVPVKIGQNVVGSLCLLREAHRTRGFDDDLRLLAVISSVLARAVELRQAAQARLSLLQKENERLQQEIESRHRPSNMVGNSGAMNAVYEQIGQVAATPASVLIRGESGTGKELVAQALHERSPRKGKPFVRFNCAALPETIIESELFGHEKGAFTGAHALRKGRFEAADGGTLFLDEIGDITPQTQVKLLRVLQEKIIERLGSHDPRPVDVRILAATSRNLEDMMREGRFREDLYYRLNVFPIYLPALRERKSDILLLADHFIEEFARQMGKPVRRITTAAIDLLMAYHWPGNVRELQNCIQRAILLCNGEALEAHHLPPTLQMRASDSGGRGMLRSAVEGLEREMIVDALKRHQGIMAKAAAELGVTERTMGLRVRKYEIDFARFRPG